MKRIVVTAPQLTDIVARELDGCEIIGGDHAMTREELAEQIVEADALLSSLSDPLDADTDDGGVSDGDEVAAACERVNADPSVRCVVLTGAGPKAFVAGADISEMNSLTPVEGREVTLESLREYGSQFIAGYKLPRELITRPIPRNPSGKILKHVLRDAITEGTVATS